jgi:AraC family transcriptional regulator, regulatory protein of adaptative response / DNA-3-methyladenine glycosylase II
MDILDDASAYRALLSRDRRFDGHFFVAVRTTGIYCRPVCRVRAPKPSSCRFYATAAAAEAGGFRPCLRCRPERAPGVSLIDSPEALASAAARLLESGLGNDGIEPVAARLGITDRHLRRIFLARFGVTPVAYAQTQRLLLAKRLIQDTSLPLTEVALAAGFGSLRRFNALFLERYRMAPGQIRASAAEPARSATEGDAMDAFDLHLDYRPPLHWEALLTFFRGRAVPGVEVVDEHSYRRCVRLSQLDGKEASGWIAVSHVPERNALRLTVASSLKCALPALLVAVRRQFDLDCDPERVAAVLGPLAAPRPGLRLPGAIDPFEQSVRAVLGQQVTVAAATTLAGRLAGAFGTPIETPFPALNRLFPTAATIAALEPVALAEQRILMARARCIHAIASAITDGRLALRPEAPVDDVLNVLRTLPGIGEWTAQYMAMRCLSWPDAFPHTDLVIKKAFPGLKPAEILVAAERWRPWRAYATLHLWKETM